MTTFSAGFIGYGYWGPNLVRNFMATEGVDVKLICDLNQRARQNARKAYPGVSTSDNPDDVLTAGGIDAVVIATPVSTHYELGKRALENGKHLFIEKPFTATSAEALSLIELARKKNLVIMVDHTFLFTGSVGKIKALIDGDELGKLYYYDSTRVNLGLFQHDVNVVWDLAPHDLSIMDYILPDFPTAISATGSSHFSNGLQDVAYISMFFTDNLIAHLNVNWLSPVKKRSTLIGGEKKMLIWNDLEADEKIKIYDKGVRIDSKEGIYDLLVEYRSGDILVPRIDHTEALKVEAAYFVQCVANGEKAINDGEAGLRVVKLLEGIDRSMKDNGKMVTI